jgi:hypothetical protein
MKCWLYIVLLTVLCACSSTPDHSSSASPSLVPTEVREVPTTLPGPDASTSVAPAPAPAPIPPTEPRKPMTLQEALEAAITTRGSTYLEAERRLREGGPEAAALLRKNLAQADPVARMVVQTLLDWYVGHAGDYKGVLDYFEWIVKWDASTVVGTPRADGTEGYLSQEYGARLTHFLAVRLLKEGDDLPRWKLGATVLYLRAHPTPSVTEVLLRYAVETKNEDWQGLLPRMQTIETIVAIKDPKLQQKLEAERARCKNLGVPFPAELEALAAKKP